MDRVLSFTVSIALVAACGGKPAPAPQSGGTTTPPPAAAPAPAGSEPEKMATATDVVTSSGVTVPVVAGWYVTRAGDKLRLEDPDRQLSMWLVENHEKDAAAAIAAAWKVVDPAFARTIKVTVSPPATDGWDALTQTVYETGSTEQRTVVAVARRRGEVWYLALIDTADGALDRRGAQLNQILDGMKVPGVERESLAGKKAHPLDRERLAGFEAFVADAMKQAGVPGVSIAIVQDGKVIYEKGLGVRELGKKSPVTPRTAFMIGSTTKSLTSLMMAVLVDDKRFTWDTPVSELYPGFALGDPEATRKLMIKHTMCACTGLPRQDMEFVFEFAGKSAEQWVASLATMKPTTGFGETFQYSNTLVAAGGYIAAKVAEPKKKLAAAYLAALHSRVLDPLGMKATTFDPKQVARRDHARPHARLLDETTRALPISAEDAVVAVAPAGAAWSTVQDMARYIQLELAGGRTPAGKQLVSAEGIARRREPQVKIQDRTSYGLGMFLDEELGVKVYGHGGNTLGFTSELVFLPDHGVGMVLLTNAGGANAFRSAVRRKLLEVLFDARQEAATDLAFSLKERTKRLGELRAKVAAADPAWADKLVGTYHNDSLGSLTVSRIKGKYVMDAGEWKSELGRLTETDGAIRVVLTDPPLAGLDFAIDGTSLALELPQQRYVFSRK